MPAKKGRGPSRRDYADFLSINKRMNTLALSLLDQASETETVPKDGKRVIVQVTPLATQLDIFNSVGKYIAIKNRGTGDDDDKGDGLRGYSEQLGATEAETDQRNTHPGRERGIPNSTRNGVPIGPSGGKRLDYFKRRLPGNDSVVDAGGADPVGKA